MNEKRISDYTINKQQKLPHEKLEVFNVAIEFIELVDALGTLRQSAGARDQLRRASTSIAVNIGEACGKSINSKDRCHFFMIARGSTLESAAALRVLLALKLINTNQYQQTRNLCVRLYAMLTKLALR